MEKGELKKREGRRAEKKNKEDEMKMLNLEMMKDDKKGEIAQLKGQKEGLEENVSLIEQYLEKYYEELTEKDKRKRDSNGDHDDREPKKIKMVSISPNCTKHSLTIPNILKHFFFSK